MLRGTLKDVAVLNEVMVRNFDEDHLALAAHKEYFSSRQPRPTSWQCQKPLQIARNLKTGLSPKLWTHLTRTILCKEVCW
jgi:hypothetical protein